MQRTHDDPQVGLVAVGFSPADRLAAITRHLGWPGRTLSDPDRALYTRLGVGRAPSWRVYSPGTLATYARAVTTGTSLRPADEDTRQLGADAVLVNSVIRVLWRPRSPDDRPPALDVLTEARAATEGGPGSGGLPRHGH